MIVNFNDIKVWSGEVTSRDFNRLVDALQTLSINPGVNYSIKRTPAGTNLVLGGSAPLTTACPFTVSLVANPDDPSTATATITPGTVNFFVPSNLFDTFSVSTTGTYYVKVSVTSDGQSVTAVEYNVDDSTPDQQTPTPFSLPTSFDILLAIIYNGRVFRVIDCGSISLIGQQTFITDKTDADPGSLPYTAYFIWVAQ